MLLSKQDIEEIGKIVESKLVFIEQNIIKELCEDVNDLREQINNLTTTLRDSMQKLDIEIFAQGK